jgi:ATP-dependent Clp protease protease subunit
MHKKYYNNLFQNSVMKKNQITVPLDALPEDLRSRLMDAIEQQKQLKNENEEVEDFFQTFSTQSEDKILEERGIFTINEIISTKSLSSIMNKMLALHFNETFEDTIQLIINSPGGYLDATWAFIDLMESIRLPIRTIAMGEIASGATMIFVAGDERVMSPNVTTMIHHFSSGIAGSYPELIAARKNQDMETKKIVNHFKKYSKLKTQKEVLDKILLTQDHYLSPQEMKKFGLCDIILRKKSFKK